MDFMLALEECGRDIEALDSQITEYNIHDVYNSLFEEKSASVKTQLVKNNKTKESGGIINGIGNIAKKLIDAIKNIIDSMVNFIQTLTLSGQEKVQYEAFVKKCSEHPKLKDKKITVMDYKKYYGDYKLLLAEVKRAEKDILSGKSVELDAIEGKVKKFIAGGASGVLASVGIGTALRYASSSKQISAMINKELQDPLVMDTLKSAVGEKEANRLFKDTKKMSHFLSAQRIWMMLTGNAARSIETASKKTFEDAANLVKSVQDLDMPGYDPEHNILVNMAKRVGHVIAHPGKSAKVAKYYIKNKRVIDAGMGNEEIKGTVKAAKEFIKNKHDAERGDVLAKRGIPGKQTAFAALTGVNDPEAKINKDLDKHKKEKEKEREEFMNAY